MKVLTLPLLFLTMSLHGQAIFGKWKTIDDESGEVKSIVEIFEKEGKAYGKVIRIFPPAGEDPDPVCEECDNNDPRYGKKIIGMEIITGMEKVDGQYGNGEILDPENGKVYRCRVWTEGEDLKVRGYWGPFY